MKRANIRRASAVAWLACAAGAAVAAAPSSAHGSSTAVPQLSRPQLALPEAVRRDLAAGRYWKASEALAEHVGPLATASFAERIALAEARAGWKNWRGAVEALTAGQPDTTQAPAGYWYLLGTALQAAGDREEAGSALRRFLASETGPSRRRTAALSRLAQLEAERDVPGAAVEVVTELANASPVLAGWTALAAAQTLAESGRAETVSQLLSLVVDAEVKRRGWDLEATAWAARGDTARALAALERVKDGAFGTVPAQAAILDREWTYRLALGDTAAAIAVMHELLSHTTRGSPAARAATALWQHDAAGPDPDSYRKVAEALGGAREYGDATGAWEAVIEAGVGLSEPEQMALARAYNGSRERDAAASIYRKLSESSNSETAARALRSLANIRQVQGRPREMAILEERLVERFPEQPQAVDVVFFRGDSHHDAGRLDEALDHYDRVVSMVSSADRAGLARMRSAQIYLTRGDPEGAARVYRDYLEEFQDGRRWQEASFWGARTALAIGDTARAEELTARLRRESPLSYYAMQAADAEGTAFVAALPQGPVIPPPDGWLAEELNLLALLEEANLEEGARVHAAAMAADVADSDDLSLRLAAAFNERGRTMDGIELGWKLQRRGRPWDQTLARVIYPFPYQDLVTARAEELGLDPYLVAGLIRQESAFEKAIVSVAGAVGLMQVMPATGEELARRVGPPGFRPESLKTPELNVHLGTSYLAGLYERYEGKLPLVLSAYNAGPTRANRWRRFPEAQDPLRFTERIPFSETRGYVKNVTRNRALYRWLYGG